MKPVTYFIRQAPGNVVALIQDGRVDSAIFGDGDPRPAPQAALAEIAELSWTDPQPRSIELPDLGWYRMIGRPGDGDEILVTGCPGRRPGTPAWDAMCSKPRSFPG